MGLEYIYSPKNIYLSIISGIIILEHLFVLIWSFRTVSEKSTYFAFKCACIITALSPIVIALNMVFRSHYSRSRILDVVIKQQYGSIYVDGVIEYKKYCIMCGIFMIGICVIGYASVIITWFRMRRYRSSSIMPIITYGGLSAAICMMSVVMIMRCKAVIKSFVTWKTVSPELKHFCLEKEIASILSTNKYMLYTVVTIIVSYIIIMYFSIAVKNIRLVISRWFATACVTVLMLGVFLFASTRNHASDADEAIELFNIFKHDHVQLYNDVYLGNRLPKMINTYNLINSSVIKVRGSRILVDDGEICNNDEASQNVEKENDGLLKVLRRKIKLEIMIRRYNNESDDEYTVIIQADRSTPGHLIADILRTCYKAGYRKIQFASDNYIEVPTAVMGSFVFFRPKALLIMLTDYAGQDIINLPEKEILWQWTDILDKASSNKIVRVSINHTS